MKRSGFRRRLSLSTADREPNASRAPTWQSLLALVVALFILNFALTFHNIWPTLWITTRHELSIEIALLLAALVTYGALVRPPSARGMTALAVVVVLLSIGRYAEVTAPALYGRPVNLYWDAPHVLNVATMLKVAASPVTAALVVAGLSPRAAPALNQVAFLVETPQVAGVEPAIAIEDLAGGTGAAPVLAHHRLSPHQHLAVVGDATVVSPTVVARP